MFLDGAFEGAGAVDWVVALIGDELEGVGGEVEVEILFGETSDDALELDSDDAGEVAVAEAVEDDGFVDAVEEFGAEVIAEGFGDAGFALFLVIDVHDELAADVAGHDEDGVFEVDGAALTVGDAAVVEDLEEDIEDIGVGLFDFVEEDDAVGAAADGFGELAAFIVADVARRGSDETADGVFFHVLAHVDAGHGVFVVEEEFS